MRCPRCRVDHDRVTNSRTGEDGLLIRRRRECLKCGKRFTTYERVEEMSFKVVKKDGAREPFQSSKIRAGLQRACWKRPLKDEQIDAVVTEIEREVYGQFEDEIDSRALGEIVMAHLANLDQVAYVRFASVYREFKDVRDFVGELQPILRKSEQTRRQLKAPK